MAMRSSADINSNFFMRPPFVPGLFGSRHSQAKNRQQGLMLWNQETQDRICGYDGASYNSTNQFLSTHLEIQEGFRGFSGSNLDFSTYKPGSVLTELIR